MGTGVEKVETSPFCRLDELGNPVPRNLFPAFPKSRRLIEGYDVVIIGGGTAGMAVAHKLAGAGMDRADAEMNAEGNLVRGVAPANAT